MAEPDHRSPAERREDERNLAHVANVAEREKQFARKARILDGARVSVAKALADIPAEVSVEDYDDGYWDGQKAAYVHVLQLLGSE